MVELPSGTVTFLLTDIEGSTALWERLPAEMRLTVARHDALLTESIERRRGAVIHNRGEGDSFFSVFSRASDAVAAGAFGSGSSAASGRPSRASHMLARNSAGSGRTQASTLRSMRSISGRRTHD